MTTRAQKIMEAFHKDETWDKEPLPDKIVVANVLRKLNDIFDEEGYEGDEPSCCVFRDIFYIIEELESL